MKKNEQIIIYLEGGLVNEVLIAGDGPKEKWKEANHIVIDSDVEGADNDQICAGCIYDPEGGHSIHGCGGDRSLADAYRETHAIVKGICAKCGTDKEGFDYECTGPKKQEAKK